MVECSDNNMNFPDHLQWQALSPLLYIDYIAGCFSITPLLYFF